MLWMGITDEAAPSIAGQIAATRALGWTAMELRNVDGASLIDLPDAAFDAVAAAIDASGLKVHCLSSPIANWARQVLDPMEQTRAEVSRAIARMQRLGTRYVRIMSYAVLSGLPAEAQHAEERFTRLREIRQRFVDAGLEPLHENCMNYGGLGASFTLRLLEAVPGLRLVFDTGNPVFSDDHDAPITQSCSTRPRQSAWGFYQQVRDHVAHVHIKDGRWDAAAGRVIFTMPGEGESDVARILADLRARGYDAGISIEPHLAGVFHEQQGREPDADERAKSFIEYGRRAEALLS